MQDRLDTVRRIATPLGIAALLLMLALLGWNAVRSYPSFDGAMNLRIARSLAEGQGYAFRYDSVFAFPAQTDGPFVLPAALVFRVFGISRLSAQTVSLLYLLALGLLVPVLLLRVGAPRWLAAVAGAACLALPGVAEYGAHGYGEIPMLCWVLAALLAANRALDRPSRRTLLLALAGFLFAVAALTKIIALICVLPGMLVCALFVARAPGGSWFRGFLALAAGLIVPIAGWEVFRLAALGSGQAWMRWWQLQLGQVITQSGTGDANLAPHLLLAKLRLHLKILSGQIGVPVPLVIVWLVLPWILAIHRLGKPDTGRGIRFLLLALVLCVLPYVIWWLLVTPTGMAWLRRILPALLLQTCLVAILLSTPHGWRRHPALLSLLAALILLPQTQMLVTGMRILAAQDPDTRSDDIRRALATMRALPQDSVFFGVGWWQAPVLSLFSGRPIMNFDRWTPERVNALPHKFFVVDGAARAIGQDQLHEVTNTTRLVPLLQTPEATLFRILSVDPDLPVRGSTPLTPVFDAQRDAMAHGGGWYPSAHGWAWVRPRSHILLIRTTQTRLVFDAAFWSELFRPGMAPLFLHVSAPGCLDQDVPLPGAGLRHLVLPLTCPPVSSPLPIDVTLVVDASMPLLHQLDADTRLRAFEVSRMALAD